MIANTTVNRLRQRMMRAWPLAVGTRCTHLMHGAVLPRGCSARFQHLLITGSR